MALRGAIISLDAFVALAIATTAFLMISFNVSTMYSYNFTGLNNSYSAIGANLSEQHFLYDQYLSNLTPSQLSSMAEAQGYDMRGFYNSSTTAENGRVVSVQGKVYIITRVGGGNDEGPN